MRLIFLKSNGFDRYAIKTDDNLKIKIQPTVARCLLALMFNPYMTTQELSEAIWPDPDTMPDIWAVGVRQRVFMANRRLKRGGMKITSDQNSGWRLVYIND